MQKMISHSLQPMSANNMQRKNTLRHSDKFNLMNNKLSNQVKNPSKLLLLKSNLPPQERKASLKIEIQPFISIMKSLLRSKKNTEADKVK